MSVLSFLKRNAMQPQGGLSATVAAAHASPVAAIGSSDEYIDKVKRDIDANRLDLKGNATVMQPCPFAAAEAVNDARRRSGASLLTAHDLAHLALRPVVVAWVPEKIYPGVSVKCPNCKKIASPARWCRTRILHGLERQSAYITKEYICYSCEAEPRLKHARGDEEDGGPKRRKQRAFQADAAGALALLPPVVSSTWRLVNSGRVLCEAGVVDFVRALATRTSWSAIAEALNELKEAAWERQVTQLHMDLCKTLLGDVYVDAVALPSEHRLSADWVRNMYVSDAEKRHRAVSTELSAEKGDDVLALDWTVDAAARCSSSFLFNAMDGQGHLLMSSLTTTCSPYGVKNLLAALRQRGVAPRVVYVDCECCGSWRAIINGIWPTASIKLDGMHAIRRLTRTTTSTQNPLHGRFCAALSAAIYTYDSDTLSRLQAAQRREGQRGRLTTRARNKYVPRVIVDAERIAHDIDEVIEKFRGMPSGAGPLLTTATQEAWRDLRPHVLAGCLCDPPAMQMNTTGSPVTIGGEQFQTIRTLRGASALEGFHTHQKQWLGCLGRHAADAGTALLADGAVRWNRKRRRERGEG